MKTWKFEFSLIWSVFEVEEEERKNHLYFSKHHGDIETNVSKMSYFMCQYDGSLTENTLKTTQTFDFSQRFVHVPRTIFTLETWKSIFVIRFVTSMALWPFACGTWQPQSEPLALTKLQMAISRDLGRVRRRAYTHFEAEIRGFQLIWVLSSNSL